MTEPRHAPGGRAAQLVHRVGAAPDRRHQAGIGRLAGVGATDHFVPSRTGVRPTLSVPTLVAFLTVVLILLVRVPLRLSANRVGT